MNSFAEFLKVNYINSMKLPRDILELIFEKYILSLIDDKDNIYAIDDFEKPNILLVKTLINNGYKCTFLTMINACKNNNIELVKYLLSINININNSVKYAIENNNIELVKLLFDNGADFMYKYVYTALYNNHFEIADYFYKKFKFNCELLITEKYSPNNYLSVLKWLKNNHSGQFKKEFRLAILTNNVIENNNIELLKYIIENNIFLLSFESICRCLNNLEMLKIIDEHNKKCQPIYYHESDYINNIFEYILDMNNLDLLKYYFESNMETSIFKYFIDNKDKDTVYKVNMNNMNEIDNYNLSYKIIKWLYTNTKIRFNKDDLLKLNNIKNNLYMLEWLYNNNHITFSPNDLYDITDNYMYYNCVEFIISVMRLEEQDDINNIIRIAYNELSRGNIILLKLLHKKIMLLEEEHILKWKDIHYDAMDDAYKYKIFDCINYIKNPIVWTRNGINYLDLE